MVPGTKAALIHFYGFFEDSGDDLAAAIGEAKQAGATGLILDLRGNPGGLFEEAVSVASLFLGRKRRRRRRT